MRVNNMLSMEERIIQAFEKSMAEYDPTQKSRHWQRFFNEKRHLFKKESLENFRNNTLSDGLDDRFHPSMQKSVFCEVLAECGPDFVFKNLSKKNIGNAHEIFTIGDKIVDAGQCVHIRWLFDLTNFVFSKKNIKYICEIGGGYGSLAQKIRSNGEYKYIFIDLPEANALASYYLSGHFPDLKFLLADGVQNKSVSREQIDAYDFIIIPPWYEIKDIKIDLFINTRSMMEMNTEAIQRYFDRIHNTAADNGFFLNINRYRKDTVGYPIRFWEYPYDERWNVVVSKPSFRQPAIHALITQRTSGRGDIKEELARIETLYQKKERQTRSLKKLVQPVALFFVGLPFKILRAFLPRRIYDRARRAIISQL